MFINLEFVSSTPATAIADFNAAANMLDNLIIDNITVNITVNWSGSGGGATGDPASGLYENYSTVYGILTGNASPGDTTFTGLPAGTSIQGHSSVAVWDAELKAMGLISGTATAVDGQSSFSTDISSSLLVGVALHEFGHALGRVPFAPTFDVSELFRFTSPGVRLNNSSIPAPPHNRISRSTTVASHGPCGAGTPIPAPGWTTTFSPRTIRSTSLTAAARSNI